MDGRSGVRARRGGLADGRIVASQTLDQDEDWEAFCFSCHPLLQTSLRLTLVYLVQMSSVGV